MGTPTFETFLDFLICNFYLAEYRQIYVMPEDIEDKDYMMSQILIDNGYLDLLL